MIIAAGLDLGGTLVERKSEVDDDSIRRIQACLGNPAPTEVEIPKLRQYLETLETRAWGSFDPHQIMSIRTTGEEFDFLRSKFYPSVLQNWGLRHPPQELIYTLATRQLGPDTFHCFPDATPCLKKLHEIGILVACISNSMPSAETILQHLGLTKMFDCLVLSHSAGCRCMKPDPRIHHHALENLNVTGDDALYVDDRPGLVEAARSIYRKAILLDRNDRYLSFEGTRVKNLNEVLDYISSTQIATSMHRNIP